MENIIRQIIKEELTKALLEIHTQVISQSEDEIIYNFESGRAFGTNKLSKDIRGLSNYYMSEYFPHSEMDEGWMFEIENNYGGNQLIEITHQIGSDYNSAWKLEVSDVARGSNEPVIIGTSGYVKGYRNFIDKVNSTMEKLINPELL